MKRVLRFFLFLLPLGLVWLAGGCDLVTVPRPLTETKPADHVVINKVFTLPPDRYYAFSWVEIYNPTSQRIGGIRRWSLTYSFDLGPSPFTGVDTTIRYRLQFDRFGNEPDTLEPNEFLLMVGDTVKLQDHTDLGPGRYILENFTNFNFFSGGRIRHLFQLLETDELILSDTAGIPVDVVRYGNYVPAQPDSTPGNISAGVIPEWYALARYAGAYSTGNTANDFYMEPKPVPAWYNPLGHP